MTTAVISGSSSTLAYTVGGGSPPNGGSLVGTGGPISGVTSNNTPANFTTTNSLSSTTRNTSTSTVGIVGSTVAARERASTRAFDKGAAIPTEGSTDMGVTIADMGFGFGLSLIFVVFIGGLVAV